MNGVHLLATAAYSPAAAIPGVQRSRNRQIPLVCALAIAVLHFVWVTAHLAPAIMSPDANGYVVQARLIADEGRFSFSTASPVQFVGMHWLETERGVFQSRYPAGLPVLFAAAWKVGGIRTALLINPLLASATVLMAFFLARRLMSERFSLLATLFVAFLPIANQHALNAGTHTAAAFFLVAGVLALLRFKKTRSVGAGCLAGVLLGAIPTMRYPEAIVGLTLGAWMLWQMRPRWRIGSVLVGAALPIAALLAHNVESYGEFWRTGYALSNEQSGFGFGSFASHGVPDLQGLSGPALALMFAFGAAGIAALVVDQVRRADGVLFAGLTAPLVLLYMAYSLGGGATGGDESSLRFLIPTYPFFAVAGVWLLARLAHQLGSAGQAAVTVMAVLQVVAGFGASRNTLSEARASLGMAARARVAAEQEIPPGSVVIADRSLAESFDAMGRWKIVEENLIADTSGPRAAGGDLAGDVDRRTVGGARTVDGESFRPAGSESTKREGGRDPSPRLPPVDRNQAQQERYAGLGPEDRRARVWADIQLWAAGRPIFWFTRSVDVVEAALPAGIDYRDVREVDAPRRFGSMRGRRPGGPAVAHNGGAVHPARVVADRIGVDGTGERRGGPEGSGDNPHGSPSAFPVGQLRIVRVDFSE